MYRRGVGEDIAVADCGDSDQAEVECGLVLRHLRNADAVRFPRPTAAGQRAVNLESVRNFQESACEFNTRWLGIL